MTETRKKVLSLFEAHRETPGAPFDESHFLDYLLANPRQNRAVNNSFKGLRRLNAFRDRLQYEFEIFFSVKDREANYSLDRFVERVEELKNNPASSLASLRSPMKGKVEGIVVVGPLLFWVPAFVFREHAVIASLLFVSGAGLLGFFVRVYWRERNYLNRLYVKIKTSSQSEAQQGAPGDAAKRRT